MFVADGKHGPNLQQFQYSVILRNETAAASFGYLLSVCNLATSDRSALPICLVTDKQL